VGTRTVLEGCENLAHNGIRSPGSTWSLDLSTLAEKFGELGLRVGIELGLN